MDWIQTLSIIASVGASAFYIHREIQSDIKNVREEIKSQSLRSDRLYEMFIDLIKEGKK
jgi:hypothetical protein